MCCCLLHPQRRTARMSSSRCPAPSHRRSRRNFASYMDDRIVEMKARERDLPVGVVSNQNLEDMEMNLDMLPNILGRAERKMKVHDAFDYLVQEEEGRLIDMDAVNRTAVKARRVRRHRD